MSGNVSLNPFIKLKLIDKAVTSLAPYEVYLVVIDNSFL